MPADPLLRFLEISRRRPDAVAVEENGVEIAYGALASLASRIAMACRDVGEHCRVAIHLGQGANAYAAMFGTLMAGGYYAPLNLEHPIGRRTAVLKQFNPDIVIGDREGCAALNLSGGARVIVLEDLPASGLESPAPAHDLAYVMFTSGSTGEPKGVMVGRAGLAHYVDWAIGTFAPTPADRWSQHPNIGFDLSVLDIYGALCAGARLIPLTNRRDRLLPGDAIRRHKFTIWNSVPSVVDVIRRGGHATERNLASLRLMTFCGEPLLREHLDAIFAARPDLEVFNTYGPTEATVSLTLVRLNAANYRDACDKTVTLGDPIPGMSIQLVDGPSDEEGEIVITGPQVARGYWNAPELTRKSFREIRNGGRTVTGYFTGDWAYRKNGHLFFGNRIDRQVKIHGHRLELGEIDAALRQCGVRAACTVFATGALVSFVESDGGLTGAEIQSRLRRILPGYAIPERVEILEHLPRSTNDKIDVSALTTIAARANRPTSAAQS